MHDSPTSLIDLTADGHIHTSLCNHARGGMEEYVLAALQRGLHQITFLEHLEVNIHADQRTWLRDVDFKTYFQTGKKLQEQYRNKITIKLGVEAGFNPAAIKELGLHLARYPWDAIGLSYHFYHYNDRHYNMVSRRQENLRPLAKCGINRVVNDYFTGLISGLQQLPCTKICHLDAVLRHYPHICFTPDHLRLIDELLLLMRAKATALEVNTSGFSIRNSPYPDIHIVRRAIELGIPLVAGSDAHRPEQVGQFFAQLPAWLK